MFPSTAPCRLKLDLMQWSAPWRLVGGSSHWCSAPRTWKPHGHATYPASICTWQAREVFICRVACAARGRRRRGSSQQEFARWRQKKKLRADLEDVADLAKFYSYFRFFS
ncbi:unnamed protein product [Durusdinium trenchii]|uniref:Uncharacterized protein n=1 Tax=Durusdinium trenchii TaxID=1381693 RepID=A0ABP0S176_9DINO